MSYKVSLAGDLGSGKSTVSKILIDRLGLRYYSTGAICREIAEKHHMSVVEMNLYMETHPEIDREIDDGLIALSERDEDLIIDSRMAWHFVKNTLRVYLATDPRVSAARILGDHRSTETFGDLEDAMRQIATRRKSERKRYREMYGVDNKDLCNYDLIVDTTAATPEEVADVIAGAIARYRDGQAAGGCYLCPTHLMYRDTSDPDAVAALAAKLDEGEDVGDVTVFEKDGTFFVRDGNDLALAYALSDKPFIPARLVPCEGYATEDGYVSMADSL